MSPDNIVSVNDQFRVSENAVTQLLTRDELTNDVQLILKIKKPDYLGHSRWAFRQKGAVPRALVRLIRLAADRCQPSVIGRDCVSVAIDLWHRVVEVRYFGSTVDRVGVSWTNADGTDRRHSDAHIRSH